MSPGEPRPGWRSKLLWFIALWAGGVATIGVVGLLLKLMLHS